jgi:hypothetical protein
VHTERKKRIDGEPENKNYLCDLRTVVTEKGNLKIRNTTWKFVWQMRLNKFRNLRYLTLTPCGILMTIALAPYIAV